MTKMTSIAEIIMNEVKNNKAVVFSKTTCPYSMKAKKAFETVGFKPKIIEIDQLPDMSKYQDELQSLTGARTVPRVFIGGKFFGGGSDTESAAADGSLKKLLDAA